MISPILIPIMALAVPMVIAPTAIWSRHRLRVRQMEHDERLRALELGVVPRGSGMNWPGAAVCLGLGAVAPVGSMLVAWLAVMTADAPNETFGIPLLISFAGIWAAKELADRMMGRQPEADAAPARRFVSRPGAKPAVDPDAYDVVGSRG